MIDQTTQEEKQYRFELTEFKLKNPSSDEKFYINYRIKVLEKVLVEYYETADFYEGEELDGKEFINGVWTVTKTGTASDYLYFSKELDFLKDKLIQLSEIKKEKAPEFEKPFLTGLKFATGEAQELYRKYKLEKGHFKKICLELRFKATDRPYFSETLNDSKGVKNIYNNTKVVIQIYKHCTENKIVMCDEFLSKYNQIEPE